MAMLKLNPENDGLHWELAGTPNDLDDFRALAMRGGKELDYAGTMDFIGVWLNHLREHGFGFKPGEPVFGIKADRSGPIHYLPGTIHELAEESGRLCKMLEAQAIAQEPKFGSARDSIPIPPNPQTSSVSESSPVRRMKRVDLSRYLDGANLTEKQHQCASLKWEYGLSISQIAKELAIHRKTVDEHIQSAQKKMDRSGQYDAVQKHLARFNLDD